MTPQDIFDHVATHLFTQGTRAVKKVEVVDGTVRYTCQYRTPEGLKCAIGSLIPDEAYDEKMEGMGFSGIFGKYNLPPWLSTRENFILLCDLQSCHDHLYNWHSTDRMRSVLKDVAQGHLLKSDIIKTLSLPE